MSDESIINLSRGYCFDEPKLFYITKKDSVAMFDFSNIDNFRPRLFELASFGCKIQDICLSRNGIVVLTEYCTLKRVSASVDSSKQSKPKLEHVATKYTHNNGYGSAVACLMIDASPNETTFNAVNLSSTDFAGSLTH